MNKQKLILEQTDRKIVLLKKTERLAIPSPGWIFTIRTALGMSMRQLGKRMGITPQSIKEIEEREQNGTISLKVMKQFARAMDLKLIYGFIPEEGTLKDIIEKRAAELAKEIVSRSTVSMILEDQGIGQSLVKTALKEEKEDLIRKMPKILWD